MALAMNHHNAYVVDESASVSYLHGDGDEPPPAPSVRELVERCLQGRIDSDPEVSSCFIIILLECFFSERLSLFLRFLTQLHQLTP